MTDTAAIERLRKIGEQYKRAKELLDGMADERRDAVRDALNAGESVSEVARSGKLTREQVDRIKAGVTSGRNPAWRTERDHAATSASDD